MYSGKLNAFLLSSALTSHVPEIITSRFWFSPLVITANLSSEEARGPDLDQFFGGEETAELTREEIEFRAREELRRKQEHEALEHADAMRFHTAAQVAKEEEELRLEQQQSDVPADLSALLRQLDLEEMKSAFEKVRV